MKCSVQSKLRCEVQHAACTPKYGVPGIVQVQHWLRPTFGVKCKDPVRQDWLWFDSAFCWLGAVRRENPDRLHSGEAHHSLDLVYVSVILESEASRGVACPSFTHARSVVRTPYVPSRPVVRSFRAKHSSRRPRTFASGLGSLMRTGTLKLALDLESVPAL